MFSFPWPLRSVKIVGRWWWEWEFGHTILSSSRAVHEVRMIMVGAKACGRELVAVSHGRSVERATAPAPARPPRPGARSLGSWPMAVGWLATAGWAAVDCGLWVVGGGRCDGWQQAVGCVQMQCLRRPRPGMRHHACVAVKAGVNLLWWGHYCQRAPASNHTLNDTSPPISPTCSHPTCGPPPPSHRRLLHTHPRLNASKLASAPRCWDSHSLRLRPRGGQQPRRPGLQRLR